MRKSKIFICYLLFFTFYCAIGNARINGMYDYTDEQYEDFEKIFLNSPKCKNNPNYINCLSSVVFYPFGDLMLINVLNREKMSSLDFQSGTMNPWMYGRECIDQLKLSEVSGLVNGKDYALRNLDRLYTLFKANNKKFPHSKYGKFDNGWVSCMDIPTVALCAHIAYQMSNNTYYKSIRDEMLNEIKRLPRNNGFYLPMDAKKIWLSEYSAYDTNLENELFVLNGYMVALQSINMLAKSMGDENLWGLYSEVMQAYKVLASKYWYSNNKWSYYMLNPMTPIPPHYLIYETKQLNALNYLNKDAFYAEQLDLHKEALKRALPVYQYITNEQKYALLFRGIIHPYVVDIYKTKIDFLDSHDHIVNTVFSRQSTSDYIDHFFINTPISKEAVTYRMYAINSAGASYKIVEAPLLDLSEVDEAHNQHYSWQKLDIKVSNGSLNKNQVIADKEAASTSIFLNLNSIPLSKNINQFYALEISSDAKKTLDITVYDKSKLKAANRYYQPLVPGKNLILIHWPGINNIEAIDNYSQLRVRVFNNASKNNTDTILHIGDFWLFSDTYGLYKYMQTSDFKVPSEKKL